MAESANVFPAGVLTLKGWTMMPDGATYIHVWAKAWHVVTNQESGIPGLRTADRFHAIAYGDDGTPRVIIPGCQVQGFAATPSDPSTKGGPQAYVVKS